MAMPRLLRIQRGCATGGEDGGEDSEWLCHGRGDTGPGTL